MKKILLSFTVILIFVLSLSAHAIEETGGAEVEAVKIELGDEYDIDSNSVSMLSEDKLPLDEYIYLSLYYRNLTWDIEYGGEVYHCIDLRAYDVTESELDEIIYKMIVSKPELMVYNNYFKFFIGDSPVALVPYYIYADQDTSDYERDLMMDWIDDFVDSLPESLSVEEQLLEASRFIAENVQYCKASSSLSTSRLKYSGYAAYKYNTTVCQGYTAIMSSIMEKLGIEYGLISSDCIKHVWNYVVIDGEKYHLDITWCDADSDTYVLRYKDFLISDEKREERIREDNTVKEDDELWVIHGDDSGCTSKKYESGYIWNWGNACNIKRSDDGYTVAQVYNVSGIGIDAPAFAFDSIKMTNNKAIISGITENNVLYLYGNSNENVIASVYIATYDEDGRMQTFKPALKGVILSPSAMSLYSVSKPDAYATCIFCFANNTFIPVAKNSITK